MFDNIGGKIKGLAMVVCWIGIAASVVGAIVLWSANSYYQSTIFPGFIVLAAGSLGSWLGSLFTYGFGELVENSHKEQSAPALESHTTISVESKEPPADNEKTVPAKIIPVLTSNKCDSFYPTSIKLVPMQDKCTIVLQISKQSKEPIRAIKASVRFMNLFGDETLFEDICFVCNNEDSAHWSSLPYPISIAESSIPCFSSCAITTHAYIQYGEMIAVHDNLLQSLNEIKPPKDAPVALEALFQSLSQLKGSREMIDYLQVNDSNISPDLLANLMAALRQRFEFERLYGSNHDNTIKAVRQTLDRYLSD